MSDDAKKVVLARRARFVAAAFAGMTIACGKEKAAPPQPCLEVAASEDASVPTPQVCLSAAPRDPVEPCLSPRACLSMAPPIRRDAGATTTKTKPACNPPYTIDANGTKHYKPECL